MAARRSPANGSKPDKLMRDALILALNREARDADGTPTKKLNLIAEKLVDLAIEGNVQAIREIADRMDGKPVQALAGDPESPLPLTFIDNLDSSLEWLRKVMAPTSTQNHCEGAPPPARDLP